MKQLYLTITLLLALVCGSGILQAAPLAAADTLNHYVIDNQSIRQFDGSMLVGKTIVSYQISTVSNGKDVLKIHDIQTEEGRSAYQASLTYDPVYVLDGKQIQKAEFEKLNPDAIKSMSVIKDGREDVKKYAGWENGVILIETKKDGTPVFKTDNSDGPKIIIRKR